MNALFRPAIPCLLMLCLASCSIGYNHRWTKAASEPRTTQPTELDGAWEGTWKSEPTGHTGTLRAIATRTGPSKARYHFQYKAVWKEVLSAVFSTDHKVAWNGRRGTVTGEKDLGRFGGVFRFTGTATPTEFHAKYTSKYDHGVFEMKRPE